MIGANGWTGGQYSLVRALFGAYLFVHFVTLLPYGAEVFSSAGMLPDASASPLTWLFPNVLRWFDSPSAVAALLLSAAAASLAFAAGWRDRAAALWAWYVLACLFGRNPMIQNPSLPYVGWLLLAHALIPAAPYGSWAARGRLDPDGGWRLPASIFFAAWMVLSLAYSYSGWTKLMSESWTDGSMLRHVLQNPLARDWILRDAFLSLPDAISRTLTWSILWIELLFVVFALWRPARIAAWTAMLVVQVGFALLLNFIDLTAAMLVVHLFTFDPAWIGGREAGQRDHVFYDGHCGLCHRVVRFVLAEDRDARFLLAPLQGSAFATLVPAGVRRHLPDSFIVRTERGELLSRSDAVVHVLQRLGGLWRPLGALLRTVPRGWRDHAYDAVGRVRHRLFPKPGDLCPMLPPALRERFDA